MKVMATKPDSEKNILWDIYNLLNKYSIVHNNTCKELDPTLNPDSDYEIHHSVANPRTLSTQRRKQQTLQ